MNNQIPENEQNNNSVNMCTQTETDFKQEDCFITSDNLKHVNQKEKVRYGIPANDLIGDPIFYKDTVRDGRQLMCSKPKQTPQQKRIIDYKISKSHDPKNQAKYQSNLTKPSNKKTVVSDLFKNLCEPVKKLPEIDNLYKDTKKSPENEEHFLLPRPERPKTT